MMFGKKNRPVLTAFFCMRLEQLRLAIEVWCGKRTTIACIDFNTCVANVRVDGQEMVVLFDYKNVADKFLYFNLPGYPHWFTARWDKPDEVRVVNDEPRSNLRRDHAMWVVGRSHVDRWEEPVYENNVKYCAERLGLTVEQYLNGDLPSNNAPEPTEKDVLEKM